MEDLVDSVLLLAHKHGLSIAEATLDMAEVAGFLTVETSGDVRDIAICGSALSLLQGAMCGAKALRRQGGKKARR
jgi:hypothetical protein